MINYETLKEHAKNEGYKISDLLALAAKNDPFYVGRPAEETAAMWFANIWRQFGYGSGVHLRRVHYQLVSQKPPVARPDGQPYQNTKKDWAYLNDASKWARYLNLVNADDFVDRRNPDAIIKTDWRLPGDWMYEDPAPGYSTTADWLYQDDEDDQYVLPELPRLPGLPEELPDLPDFAVTGYYGLQQDYHIEIWCEKTTVNDVLLPLCERYNVNLITGAGEMSITSVVDFLKRVQASDRPARIIYISDFDPAGLGMPISVARKIEYFQRNEGFDELDIILHPVCLTADQISEYDLPRIPVKSADLRKANFEADHGAGAVELDALEALHPGAIERIIETAILQWYDTTLLSRARSVRRHLIAALADEHAEAIDPYSDEVTQAADGYTELLDDFAETQGEFDDLVAGFVTDIQAYTERLANIKADVSDIHERVLTDLDNVYVDLDEFPLPTPDLPEQDNSLLYSSEREYFEQLQYYKDLRHGL